MSAKEPQLDMAELDRHIAQLERERDRKHIQSWERRLEQDQAIYRERELAQAVEKQKAAWAEVHRLREGLLTLKWTVHAPTEDDDDDDDASCPDAHGNCYCGLVTHNSRIDALIAPSLGLEHWLEHNRKLSVREMIQQLDNEIASYTKLLVETDPNDLEAEFPRREIERLRDLRESVLNHQTWLLVELAEAVDPF